MFFCQKKKVHHWLETNGFLMKPKLDFTLTVGCQRLVLSVSLMISWLKCAHYLLKLFQLIDSIVKKNI